MAARVVRELGVEGSDQEPALPEEHRLAVELGQHFDVLAGALHSRSPDEDAAERLLLAREVEIGFEARDLTSVGVSGDVDVEETEVLVVEHDQAGAGAENGPLEPAHSLFEPVEPHQAHECRRLAAGDDEPVEPLHLLGLPYLDRIGAEAPQHRSVVAEVALHGEDADLHVENRSCGYGGSAELRRRASQSPISIRAKPYTPYESAAAQGSLFPPVSSGVGKINSLGERNHFPTK